MPVPAKKQDDAPRWAAQGGERRQGASQTLGPTLQGGQKAPAKRVGEPESAPLPGAPPCWAPDARAALADSLREQTGRLTQPAVPAADGGVTKPREFSPLTAQPPTGVGRYRLWLPGWHPGEVEAGVRARRQRRGPRALCAALAGGRWGSGAGAGRAWRKRSRTCCTRPGMLREPHTCGARRFSLLPYLAIEAVARLQLRPFSPGLQKARGACARTPGTGCRSPGHPAGAREG